MLFPQNIWVISTPSRFSPNIRTCWSTYSFVVPSYKKEIARKSIFYLGPKIWNNLNQDIKAPPGANSFKHDSMFLSCHVRFSE